MPANGVFFTLTPLLSPYRHQQIVIYKTAYYSFYLPVALGMRYAGIYSDEAYATALSILIPIGEYFQIQDDYLDCYGTPEQIGKIGTDILDNKCSWNINVALQRANEQQRKVLDVRLQLLHFLFIMPPLMVDH